ncbi:MAG: SDR family NAD(P)-dependent oxidoreductase [Candidatus Helarchaeota archaeon]
MRERRKPSSKTDKKLRGKNCLLTGAASGIGRALARCLAKEKVNLFLADIDMENLEKVKNELDPLESKVFIGRCDVSSYADFEHLAQEVYSNLDEVDILINNAGIAAGGYVETFELADWKRVLDINLWSIIYSIKVFLPRMLERGAGYIVNTGSGAGVVGLPNHIPYVTSKFAVVGLSEALYSELSDRGIDVSVICPTVIKTNIIDRTPIAIPPEYLLQIKDEQEKQMKVEAFKRAFWDIYTRKAINVDKAAKSYVKGLKKRKLYIFDKRLVPLGQFIKGVSQSLYMRLLRREGSQYRAMIDEALAKIGLKP